MMKDGQVLQLVKDGVAIHSEQAAANGQGIDPRGFSSNRFSSRQ
jgi:hypothetical protein